MKIWKDEFNFTADLYNKICVLEQFIGDSCLWNTFSVNFVLLFCNLKQNWAPFEN